MAEEFTDRVARLAEVLGQRGERLASAESCTGGWVAKACTDRAGSSAWFDCGLVTYSNASKQALLGVGAATLAQDGAVSERTVREMVRGLLRVSGAEWGLAISGVAGPGGGSDQKPVGTVWIACSGPLGPDLARCHHFDGGRDAVRSQAVAAALDMLLDKLLEHGR